MNALNKPITLNNGAILKNRVVMAPMTSKGSTWDGQIDQEDLDFFSHRSEAAGLIVTGATAVSALGEKFSYQMSIYDDRFIPGFTKLATSLKRHGNKVLAQLYHGGANSKVSYEKHKKAVAPSGVDFHHLPYQVTELTDQDIRNLIQDFGRATRRVIKAGFDGVEIHGAYSHMIQQFFSPYSNKRDDYWGGSLEKRMNFALEIIKEVQQTAKQFAHDEFIIGYRLTEEESHKQAVGYGIKETLQLIDRLAETKLDYIHVTSDKYGKEIKETINGRTAFIFVPHVFTVEDALRGLEYGDMVSMARAALIEPEFAKKIDEGREEEIATEITSVEMAKSLYWPQKMIDWLVDPNTSEAVPDGIHYFKALASPE
ncbi:NADH-dependent flavin oxidoreductase [Terribacillus saccharophilus]|uniref:oxidoreductase n=1 Tax=Terribacillus saccharophilus TaxID=361277 RepID=UPI003D282BE8